MHFSKNIPEKQKKLVDVLLRQPTSKDGPGYIYGFFEACQLDAQTNLAPTVFSVKLGRTTNKVP